MAVYKFFRVGESLEAALRVFGELVFTSRADADELAAFDFVGEQILSVMRADVANADEAETNGIHRFRS